MLPSPSKLSRKGSGYNRLEKDSSMLGTPAYTPSRLRPVADSMSSPAPRTSRKQRSWKAAEDRAVATECQQPVINTSSDNVQVGHTMAGMHGNASKPVASSA